MMASDNMRIFLDTADTNIIRKHFATGLVDGITTNPSLIMKSGRHPEAVSYTHLRAHETPEQRV